MNISNNWWSRKVRNFNSREKISRVWSFVMLLKSSEFIFVPEYFLMSPSSLPFYYSAHILSRVRIRGQGDGCFWERRVDFGCAKKTSHLTAFLIPSFFNYFVSLLLARRYYGNSEFNNDSDDKSLRFYKLFQLLIDSREMPTIIPWINTVPVPWSAQRLSRILSFFFSHTKSLWNGEGKALLTFVFWIANQQHEETKWLWLGIRTVDH